MKIYLAQWSRDPGARYRHEAKNSAEEYWQDILYPAYTIASANFEILTLNLDGTYGYGSAFLHELFSRLGHTFKVDLDTSLLELVSDEEPYLIEEIAEYMREGREQGYVDCTN